MYVKAILLTASVLCYVFSPTESKQLYINLVQAKETRTATGKTQGTVYVLFQTGAKTNTGEQISKGTGKSIKPILHKECNAKCKISTLVKLGIKKEFAESIVNVCKEKVENPVHCIKIASSIIIAESGGGWKCKNYNCFGMGGGRFKYNSYYEGVEDFVIRYQKYWYKAKDMSFFYPPKGQKSKSRYCTSEHSSNSDVGCPNGYKHSQSFFNKLTF